MPFTLSHPAIVLPLLFRTRRWLSITGLVLGSMAPDMEYFLRLRAFGYYGHTWAGILWFDLPICLLIAGLFHGVVKRPLVRSLPLFLRARLGRLAEEPWPLRNLRSSRLLLGILAGTLSHLIWDAFTHNNSLIKVDIGWLDQRVGAFTLFRWLQYISSVVGLAAIAWFLWKLPVQPRLVKATVKIRRLFWTFNGIFTLVFWLTFVLMQETFWRGVVITLVVTGISAICLAQLLTALIMRRYFQPSQQAKAARVLKREIAHDLAHKQSSL